MADRRFLYILFMAIALAVAPAAYAGPAPTCGTSLAALGAGDGAFFQSEVFSRLVEAYNQNRSALASQSDPSIQYPANACGPLCAIHFIQGARSSAGEPLLESPVGILNAIHAAAPQWQKALSAPKIVEIMKGLAEIYLPGRRFSFDVETLDTGTGETQNVRLVQNIESRDLGQGNGIVQILSYGIFDGGLQTDGHVVILVKRQGDAITVLDSNAPGDNIAYHLKAIQVNGRLKTLRLIPDVPVYYGARDDNQSAFILHSIITARILE